MRILIIVNEAPYTGERACSALRLGTALLNGGDAVRMFFMGDGAFSAARGQDKPEGCAWDMEWLIARYAAAGGEAEVCRTCMESRGLREGDLLPGARRGTLETLRQWTLECERAMAF